MGKGQWCRREVNERDERISTGTPRTYYRAKNTYKLCDVLDEYNIRKKV